MKMHYKRGQENSTIDQFFVLFLHKIGCAATKLLYSFLKKYNLCFQLSFLVLSCHWMYYCKSIQSTLFLGGTSLFPSKRKLNFIQNSSQHVCGAQEIRVIYNIRLAWLGIVLLWKGNYKSSYYTHLQISPDIS